MNALFGALPDERPEPGSALRWTSVRDRPPESDIPACPGPGRDPAAGGCGADWIDSWPARWRKETDAAWAVSVAGAVVGQVGLRHVDLDQGSAAVSYWVLPQARNRHVARRALGVLAYWSFETLGLHRLALSHSAANPASCRVAQHAGFAAEGTKRGEGRHADGWHDMHLHARLLTDI